MKKKSLAVILSFGIAVALPTWAEKNQGGLRYQLTIESSAPTRSGPLGGYAEIVEQVAPAVVSIVTTVKARPQPTQMPDLFNDPMFRRFFGDPFGEQSPQGRPRQTPAPRQQGQGSGVVVTSDGYIVTNNHVIDNAEEIEVTLPGDRKSYRAEVVGTDPATDLALIKIDKSGIPAVTVGDSSQMKPGDTVLAIGNPFGLSQTVTTGIVSAIGRNSLGITGRNGYENFIQTDASINPGNSGGALIDNQGRLIGINTAIFSRSGGNNGIGFAIPVNLAVDIMDRLMSDGEVRRGFLGVTIGDVTEDLAQGFGVEPKGALVNEVNPDTPAEKAGIQPGDIIVKFNGRDVADVAALRFMVASTDPSKKVDVDVIRQGKTKTVAVELGRLPTGEVASATTRPGNPQPAAKEFLPGVEVASLTSESREAARLPQDMDGVVVTSIEPNSNAAEAGLREGDIIVSINRQNVSSPAEAARLSETVKGPVLVIRIFNQAGSRFLAVEKG